MSIPVLEGHAITSAMRKYYSATSTAIAPATFPRLLFQELETIIKNTPRYEVLF